jgi:hypothetical protein
MIGIVVITVLLFITSMLGMYLVNDGRNGIIYKGFVGKIQNLIKH